MREVRAMASSEREYLASAPAWRKIMRFYTTLKPGIKAMKLPLVGPLLQRLLIQEGVDANWFIPAGDLVPAGESIPVGEAIPTGRRCALPQAAVERLLGEADGIFAMHACPCRTATGISTITVCPGCRYRSARTARCAATASWHAMAAHG